MGWVGGGVVGVQASTHPPSDWIRHEVQQKQTCTLAHSRNTFTVVFPLCCSGKQCFSCNVLSVSICGTFVIVLWVFASSASTVCLHPGWTVWVFFWVKQDNILMYKNITVQYGCIEKPSTKSLSLYCNRVLHVLSQKWKSVKLLHNLANVVSHQKQNYIKFALIFKW